MMWSHFTNKDNHISGEVWDEITYPFNGCTVDILKRTSMFIPHFLMDVIIHAEINVKLC